MYEEKPLQMGKEMHVVLINYKKDYIRTPMKELTWNSQTMWLLHQI